MAKAKSKIDNNRTSHDKERCSEARFIYHVCINFLPFDRKFINFTIFFFALPWLLFILVTTFNSVAYLFHSLGIRCVFHFTDEN